MVKVVIDTSVWITFFGGKDQNIIHAVRELLNRDQVLICPPVYQEILQGIKYPNEFFEMKEMLNALRQIQVDPFEAAEGAAQIYSVLRSKGITIRKSYDCLIAWYSINVGASLFHLDKDFNPIAEYFNLQIFTMDQ